MTLSFSFLFDKFRVKSENGWKWLSRHLSPCIWLDDDTDTWRFVSGERGPVRPGTYKPASPVIPSCNCNFFFFLFFLIFFHLFSMIAIFVAECCILYRLFPWFVHNWFGINVARNRLAQVRSLHFLLIFMFGMLSMGQMLVMAAR